MKIQNYNVTLLAQNKSGLTLAYGIFHRETLSCQTAEDAIINAFYTGLLAIDSIADDYETKPYRIASDVIVYIDKEIAEVDRSTTRTLYSYGSIQFEHIDGEHDRDIYIKGIYQESATNKPVEIRLNQKWDAESKTWRDTVSIGGRVFVHKNENGEDAYLVGHNHYAEL